MNTACSSHLQNSPMAKVPPTTGVSGHSMKEALVCGDSMLEQAPGKNCSPLRGDCAEAGVLTGASVCWGDPCWSSSLLKDYSLWKKTHDRAVLEELQHVERNYIGEVHEGIYPMGLILFIHTHPGTTYPATQRMESKSTLAFRFPLV